MKHLYLFSGLGADHRVFRRLDLSPYQVTHIQWITPYEKESIESYAKRLCVQIKSEKPILVGLSFGGIIATEVGKHIETEKIILISSIKSRKEVPLSYRVSHALRILKIIPASWFKKTNPVLFHLFGTKTVEEKSLLKEILEDTNPIFLQWAMERIACWPNIVRHPNLYQIHGTDDKILPISKDARIRSIKGGTHFMVFNRAAEVDVLLEEILST